jgi:fatty-acyl-CoA synthase
MTGTKKAEDPRRAMSAVDPIAQQAQRRPERLALRDLTSGRRWTYGALDRAVGQWAAVLRRDFGIVVGDRVALLAKNGAEVIQLHFACARLGAIFTPLNWRLSGAELAALIGDAEPRLIAGDGESERLGVEGVPLEALRAAAEASDPLPPAPVNPDRPSLMLFTSGTSGRPKGALLSERNLLQTAVNFGELGRVTPDSVFLVDAPMFHIIGLVTCIRPPLLQGGAILVSDGFEPSRTLERLGDPALGVTHYFCVPQMAQRLRAAAQFDPSRLKGLAAIFTGGAPLPAADIRSWLEAGIAIVNGYGMTEAGTVFGMPVDADAIAAKPGSVGFGTAGIGVRIVDAGERDCPDGVAGELLLKGENIFAGYWRQPNETAKAFTAEGWFRTGDVALRDAEGHYWLVDRKKDMFVSGGENIYPAEIEAALAGCPGVAEASCVGVPDAQWGEVGHLAVVPAPGSPLTADAVLEFLGTALARYKLPKHVSLVDSLPRTASGKIQKSILRTRLLDARNDVGAGANPSHSPTR